MGAQRDRVRCSVVRRPGADSICRPLKPRRHRLTDKETLPGASIRLSSLGLLLYGPEVLYHLMLAVVADHFLMVVCDEKVSRLDIAQDFQGLSPATCGAQFICAANYRPAFPNIDRPETYQFGKGDSVARVYNKTKEIGVSGKSYMRAVWAQARTYDEGADVWRFEIQLRRKVLRELGCETPAQAFSMTADLLNYGLDWCDLRIPDGLSSDRWERHPPGSSWLLRRGTEDSIDWPTIARC